MNTMSSTGVLSLASFCSPFVSGTLRWTKATSTSVPKPTQRTMNTVSYTHLTLPTILRV